MYILCILSFFIVIGLLVYIELYMKNIYNESFKNKKILKSGQKHVVFFGDSILENSNYVDYDKTVESVLTNPKKYGYVVENFAEDDAIINDINEQFNDFFRTNRIPLSKKRKIRDNGMIIISAGGNDLLNKYHNSKNNVKDMSYFDNIWNKYKEMIKKIEKNIKTNVDGKYKNINFGLVGLYFPFDKKYKNYDKLVEKWNKNLKNLSSKNKNMEYIDLSIVFNNKKHFVDDIEPSSKGSELIAKQINVTHKKVINSN